MTETDFWDNMIYLCLANNINENREDIVHCFYLNFTFVMVNNCRLDSVEAFVNAVEFFSWICMVLNSFNCFDCFCIRNWFSVFNVERVKWRACWVSAFSSMNCAVVHCWWSIWICESKTFSENEFVFDLKIFHHIFLFHLLYVIASFNKKSILFFIFVLVHSKQSFKDLCEKIFFNWYLDVSK